MKTFAPKKINDSNDMLGYILFIKDKNGDFKIDKVIEKIGTERNADFNKYINELIESKCICIQGTNEGHLFPEAKKMYISNLKKIWLKIQSPLYIFGGYVVGIINDDIKAIFHELANLIIELIKK